MRMTPWWSLFMYPVLIASTACAMDDVYLFERNYFPFVCSFFLKLMFFNLISSTSWGGKKPMLWDVAIVPLRPFFSYHNFWPTSHCSTSFLNKITLRSRVGHTQQIRHNYPRSKRRWQSIETRGREKKKKKKKKKQTLKIESLTQTLEQSYTNTLMTLTVNKDTNDKGINTSIHTVLLLFR